MTMRVLTFLHSFEPGGVERIALRLVRQWRKMGVDAPLFLGSGGGALREEFGRQLDYEVACPAPFGSRWFATIWMILCLPGAIRRIQPDILFVAGSTYSAAAVAMRLILGRDCPAIIVKISNDLGRRDLWWAARLGWRLWLNLQAPFVHTWVVMDEAMLAELPPAMARRAEVIHDPALDAARILRPQQTFRAGPQELVSIGRLVAQKNYAMMIEAFAAGAPAHVRLTIFGDGPERKALERLTAQLGVEDRVYFAGHVPDAASHLGKFDTFLSSSRYEGVPAALLEALSSGLSVIATDSGAGVRSLLGHGRYGTIVPLSTAALADAISGRPTTKRPVDLHEHLSRFTLEKASIA